MGEQEKARKMTHAADTPAGKPLCDDERQKRVRDAARRALAEAEERRVAQAQSEAREAEINGPKGPEPTRYGDWEKKGIAYDF